MTPTPEQNQLIDQITVIMKQSQLSNSDIRQIKALIKLLPDEMAAWYHEGLFLIEKDTTQFPPK